MLQCNKHPVRSLQIFNQFQFCFSWLDDFRLACLMKHSLSRQPQRSVKQGRGVFSVCFLRRSPYSCDWPPCPPHAPVHGLKEQASPSWPPCPCGRWCLAGTRSDQQRHYKLHIPYKQEVYRVPEDIQVPKWQLQNTRCICTRNKFSYKSAKCN